MDDLKTFVRGGNRPKTKAARMTRKQWAYTVLFYMIYVGWNLAIWLFHLNRWLLLVGFTVGLIYIAFLLWPRDDGRQP